MIRNLISITRERFILSSMVVPDRIKNRFGTLELACGHCLLVPTLSKPQQEMLINHFSKIGIGSAGFNVQYHPPVKPDGRFSYFPWWWLYTAETLFGMCEMFGVVIEKTWISSHGSASVLARVDSTE